MGEPELQPENVYVEWSLGVSFAWERNSSVPEIVEDQNGAPRLEMSRDNPCVVQHPRYQM